MHPLEITNALSENPPPDLVGPERSLPAKAAPFGQFAALQIGQETFLVRSGHQFPQHPTTRRHSTPSTLVEGNDRPDNARARPNVDHKEAGMVNKQDGFPQMAACRWKAAARDWRSAPPEVADARRRFLICRNLPPLPPACGPYSRSRPLRDTASMRPQRPGRRCRGAPTVSFRRTSRGTWRR